MNSAELFLDNDCVGGWYGISQLSRCHFGQIPKQCEDRADHIAEQGGYMDQDSATR